MGPGVGRQPAGHAVTDVHLVDSPARSPPKLVGSYTVRGLDFYEFRMAFGPVLRISSDAPLAVIDWRVDWVRPLRQLVSLLTAGPREIRYVLTVVSDAIPRSHRDLLPLHRAPMTDWPPAGGLL